MISTYPNSSATRRVFCFWRIVPGGAFGGTYSAEQEELGLAPPQL